MAELREVARLYSIETSYTDAAGKTQEAARDALVAMIEKRAGVALREAREKFEREAAGRIAEPVHVVWGGAVAPMRVNAPERSAVDWHLTLEDGTTREGRAVVAAGRIDLGISLPDGYHTLRLGQEESLLIAAPMEAQRPPRTWGAFAPLYALHSRRSWGAGDVGDLLRCASWIGELGGGVVATLPLLASFDDERSPYSPVSRLYWNEMYLDLTRVPEFRESDVDSGRLANLQQSAEVHYDELRREKRRVLERCAARFRPDDAFAAFAKKARDFAAFMAGRERRPEAVGYHLYAQYRMAEQMRELAAEVRRIGAGLYLDFPLGVHPDGFDAQTRGELFAAGVSVGAPPDPFFSKGQDWGFPPLDPDAIRRDGYRYFREAVAFHASHAGMLRIDHVMGLHRLYWIPEGAPADAGLYVRYREEELYAILVLESRRHGCAIIGEDLGTVPPEVPEEMQKHGLGRMYVVQYEARPERPPVGDPATRSLASVNTHDMPTFASYWTGRDVDERLESGLLDDAGAGRERDAREEVRRAIVSFLVERELLSAPTRDARLVLNALLAFLASSRAEIVLVNLEDLWGEGNPQNVPGVPERSWRHKFRMGIEEIESNGSIRQLLAMIDRQRRSTALQSGVALPKTNVS